MKNSPALHLYRKPWVVGENESRCMIRRVVSPPALPLVVGPLSANRAEHVAAENEGAEPKHGPGGEIVVDTFRPAFLSEHPVEVPATDMSLEHLGPTLAERIFETLLRSCAEAVYRQREPGNDHPAHGRSFLYAICKQLCSNKTVSILQAVYGDAHGQALPLRLPDQSNP